MTSHASTNSSSDSFVDPRKPVRIILPFAPGGGASATVRIFADRLSKDTGQPFIVENHPGANSVVATQELVRSAPDGHTLLVTTPTIAINHWARADLPFDTLKDLVGVSTLILNNKMMAMHPSVPATNLKELIAYARQHPGELKSTAQPNTNSYLGNLLFMKATGTRITIVTGGEGGSDHNDALLTGKVHLSLDTPSSFIAHLKSGTLKGVAISGAKRNPVLPDVPTFSEAGLEGFNISNWYMLFAPAATPAHIVEALNGYVAKVQASAEVQRALAGEGVEPFPNSVVATNAFFRSEVERFGEAMKADRT